MGGVNRQIYPKSARFELVSSFALASQSSFVSIYIYDQNQQSCLTHLDVSWLMADPKVVQKSISFCEKTAVNIRLCCWLLAG